MNNFSVKCTICVVIPCFKVRKHILSVINKIGPEVSRIYVVDDACPDGSGVYAQEHCLDDRVVVIFHRVNQGVGGAVMTGYKAALEEKMDIIVKIDGDDQMDPSIISNFVEPIILGQADYTKGNRFYDIESVVQMPKIRLLGNAALSFMSKMSSGYWDLFDPTNGYTAIHADVAKLLPLHKISKRYFFETDMLFRLNTLRASVVDIPMVAKYADEESNLKVSKVLGEFFIKHVRNAAKRVFYNYYLRDLSLASFELPIGIAMLGFSCVFGVYNWVDSLNSNMPSSAGTVMLAALPAIIGLQFVLAFLSYDIASVPNRAIHSRKIFSKNTS